MKRQLSAALAMTVWVTALALFIPHPGFTLFFSLFAALVVWPLAFARQPR